MKIIMRIIATFLLCGTCACVMAQGEIVIHVVQRGETLESIAKLYNVSVDDVKKVNGDGDILVYAGMKLTIPTDDGKVIRSVGNLPTGLGEYPRPGFGAPTETDGNEPNVWRKNQTRVMFGVEYCALSFKSAKESGHYGLTLDVLNIGGSLFGGSLTMGSFNYGLVGKDYTSDLVQFGPTISCELAKNLLVSLPVQCLCDVSFSGSNINAHWGWGLSPRAYYCARRVSFNAGVIVDGEFSKKNKVNCGFVTGVSFMFN